jgi:hypothetical protein
MGVERGAPGTDLEQVTAVRARQSEEPTGTARIAKKNETQELRLSAWAWPEQAGQPFT